MKEKLKIVLFTVVVFWNSIKAQTADLKENNHTLITAITYNLDFTKSFKAKK